MDLLGILGPLPSSNTSSYFPLHPLTLVWLWGGGGGVVVTLEDEIGNGPLTFTLIPWDLLLPPSFYILFLPATPTSSQTSS